MEEEGGPLKNTIARGAAAALLAGLLFLLLRPSPKPSGVAGARSADVGSV